MEIVRPLCRVEAPPVVILAFAPEAPSSDAMAGVAIAKVAATHVVRATFARSVKSQDRTAAGKFVVLLLPVEGASVRATRDGCAVRTTDNGAKASVLAKRNVDTRIKRNAMVLS